MQRLNISLVGNLSVTIAGSRSNTLGISVSNQQCAGYSYCPQTETITIVESPHGLPKLSLQYPGHFQLHQLTVCGSRGGGTGILGRRYLSRFFIKSNHVRKSLESPDAASLKVILERPQVRAGNIMGISLTAAPFSAMSRRLLKKKS